MSKKQVYKDPETGLAVRPVDFNSREDVELYIKASEDFAKTIRETIVPQNLAAPFYIGQAMRYHHLKKIKTKSFFILKHGKTISADAVFQVTYEQKEIYPVFILMPFETTETKTVADAYHTLGKMLKKEGNLRIFCQIPYGNTALKRELRRKEFSITGKAIEVLELDL